MQILDGSKGNRSLLNEITQLGMDVLKINKTEDSKRHCGFGGCVFLLTLDNDKSENLPHLPACWTVYFSIPGWGEQKGFQALPSVSI